MSRTWTTLDVLEWTTERFRRGGLESPRLEAQVLLSHVLGCDRVSLYMRFDEPLVERELTSFRELIQRRLGGEPVAYLVGSREFWSIRLQVDRRVLIPRPDTEAVVSAVLDRIGDRQAALAIADIGTGSGAIAIALARELPSARVVAVDASADALAVAAINVDAHGLGARIALREGDLLAPLAGETFDVVAANLPYIPSADIAGLTADVRSEPRGALDGGADGLDPIRRLVASVGAHLAPGGLVALEHAPDQATAIRELAGAAGFGDVATECDLTGRERVTVWRAANLPADSGGGKH